MMCIGRTKTKINMMINFNIIMLIKQRMKKINLLKLTQKCLYKCPIIIKFKLA